MTVATLGMAGKDAGYFFGGRANRTADRCRDTRMGEGKKEACVMKMSQSP